MDIERRKVDSDAAASHKVAILTHAEPATAGTWPATYCPTLRGFFVR